MSNWRILPSGGVQFHVEIPFGCEAEVCLPEQEPVVLRAGSYDWTLQTKRDYCRRYRPDTPLETLLADPEAEQILEELLPQFLYETDEADAEAMSKSILDAKTRASIFRMPTENYDLVIERICKLRISLTEN